MLLAVAESLAYSRSCQVADWDTHKPDCGKIKLTSPDASDRVWHHWTVEPRRPLLNIARHNVTACAKCSNPERQLSLDLQRQITLLKANPDADYFFFDDQDRPIPFVLSSPDRMVNQNFYHFQEECMFGRETKGLDVIAEYMIKVMAGQPGLNMAGILKQLSKEYSVDMKRLMVELQRKKVDKGWDPEKTFLEEMGKDMLKNFLRPE